MAYSTLWKKLSVRQLNIAIQAFSLIAIFFEGYDQGVMGGVNASPDYVREVNIGRDDGTITNETKMGGIVSVVCNDLPAVLQSYADDDSTTWDACLVASWADGLPTRLAASTASSTQLSWLSLEAFYNVLLKAPIS